VSPQIIELDWQLDRRDGRTLVMVTVRNTLETPQQVRIENALEGPTLSPRGGATGRAWDGDVREQVLRPDEIRGFGYATPTDPDGEHPPVRRIDVSRVTGQRETAEPAAILDGLDTWQPPSTVAFGETRR
jgi:hypothetical protein